MIVGFTEEGGHMLNRITQIRKQEYRFIDTDDEKNEHISEEMEPTYN